MPLLSLRPWQLCADPGESSPLLWEHATKPDWLQFYWEEHLQRRWRPSSHSGNFDIWRSGGGTLCMWLLCLQKWLWQAACRQVNIQCQKPWELWTRYKSMLCWFHMIHELCMYHTFSELINWKAIFYHFLLWLRVNAGTQMKLGGAINQKGLNIQKQGYEWI